MPRKSSSAGECAKRGIVRIGGISFGGLGAAFVSGFLMAGSGS